MKLRNKKTGEIVEWVGCTAKGLRIFLRFEDENGIFKFEVNSLAELNTEWEDYEESKEYWYIDYDGGILCRDHDNSSAEKMMISMGNLFETIEEAEKAVEKLKAWKRLKDKGFRFDGWTIDDGLKISICTNLEGGNIYSESEKEIRTNLNLLFGGEE